MAFGVLYLFVGIRQPDRRRLSLLFSGFAIAYAVAILTSRAALVSDSAEAFVAWQRVSLAFAAIGFTCFAWYVNVYTGFGTRVLLWGITALWAIFALLLLALPDAVFSADAGMTTEVLPWGEVVRIFRSETAAGFVFVILVQMAVLIFVIVAAVVQYRRGEQRDAQVLGLGVGWFAALLLIESLASIGLIRFIPVADFGFFGFVVALSISMVNRAIESEEELRQYRTDLEAMVAAQTSELRAAQHQLLEQAEAEAAAAERSRLARELHDVVTQLLFSINLIAGSLPRLWRSDQERAERSTVELQRLTKGALAEMRTLLRELRPHTIAKTDIATLMTHLADGLAARHDMPVRVEVAGESELPIDVHIAFYRIAQEAMTNVAKHADASRLAVEVLVLDDRARLIVVDDGVGIEDSAKDRGTMGLEIMRERSEAIGAELSVSTPPAGGTEVAVRWDGRNRG